MNYFKDLLRYPTGQGLTYVQMKYVQNLPSKLNVLNWLRGMDPRLLLDMGSLSISVFKESYSDFYLQKIHFIKRTTRL